MKQGYETDSKGASTAAAETLPHSRWSLLARASVGLGMALLWGAVGCHKTSAQGPAAFSYQSSQADAGEPDYGNLAPIDGQYPDQQGYAGQNEAQQQAAQYGQGAPIERRYPGGDPNAYPPQSVAANGYYNPSTDQEAMDDAQAVYEADLTDEEASEAPPPLPDYEQPMAPDDDYIWTPGYWAWSPMGYYWVPGAWVEPPYVGALWTPGYWAFYSGRYRFHHGYWGLHIGFYGGINYGYGYTGYGYYGGYWRDRHFYYNRVVNRIDVRRTTRVYDFRISEPRFAGRPSFNGPRGITVSPRPAEIVVLRERRYAPMPAQQQLRQQSMQNRQQFYTTNRGRPAMTVSSRPVVSNHQMPAALPQTTWRGGRTQGSGQNQNRGNWQGGQPGQGAQPGQSQIQVNPQGRVVPQQNQPTQGQPGYGQGRQRPQQPATPSQPQTPAGLGAWQQQQGMRPAQPQTQPQVPANQNGWQGRQRPQAPVTQPQPQPQQPAAQPPAPPQQPQTPAGLRGWQQQQGMRPVQPQSQPQDFRRGPPAQAPQAQPQQQPQQQPQFRRGPEGVRSSPPPQAAPQAQPQPQFRRGPEAPRANPQPHEQGQGHEGRDRGDHR